VTVRFTQRGGGHPISLLVIQFYYAGIVTRRATKHRPISMTIGIDHHEQQGRSAMSVPLPPNLAHRRNVRPRLGFAVRDLEAVLPWSRLAMNRHDAFAMSRARANASWMRLPPPEKCRPPRTLPSRFPIVRLHEQASSRRRWCQIAPTPTMRYISIPLIRLVYAEYGG
jgi:hypothetical protein